MLQTILIIVAVAIVGVLGYAATRPDTLKFQRSIVIAASPDRIYPRVADFKQWPTWSPYENKDPAMKREYGAITAGKGATYGWSGNGQVGVGNMEIAEATPPSKLSIKLNFEKPFQAHNTATFDFEPQGASTKVTWTMDGPATFVSKLMGVFFNMDKMVGKDFEIGLATLKAQSEGVAPPPAASEPGLVPAT